MLWLLQLPSGWPSSERLGTEEGCSTCSPAQPMMRKSEETSTREAQRRSTAAPPLSVNPACSTSVVVLSRQYRDKPQSKENRAVQVSIIHSASVCARAELSHSLVLAMLSPHSCGAFGNGALEVQPFRCAVANASSPSSVSARYAFCCGPAGRKGTVKRCPKQSGQQTWFQIAWPL